MVAEAMIPQDKRPALFKNFRTAASSSSLNVKVDGGAKTTTPPKAKSSTAAKSSGNSAKGTADAGEAEAAATLRSLQQNMDYLDVENKDHAALLRALYKNPDPSSEAAQEAAAAAAAAAEAKEKERMERRERIRKRQEARDREARRLRSAFWSEGEYKGPHVDSDAAKPDVTSTMNHIDHLRQEGVPIKSWIVVCSIVVFALYHFRRALHEPKKSSSSEAHKKQQEELDEIERQIQSLALDSGKRTSKGAKGKGGKKPGAAKSKGRAAAETKSRGRRGSNGSIKSTEQARSTPKKQKEKTAGESSNETMQQEKVASNGHESPEQEAAPPKSVKVLETPVSGGVKKESVDEGYMTSGNVADSVSTDGSSTAGMDEKDHHDDLSDDHHHHHNPRLEPAIGEEDRLAILMALNDVADTSEGEVWHTAKKRTKKDRTKARASNAAASLPSRQKEASPPPIRGGPKRNESATTSTSTQNGETRTTIPSVPTSKEVASASKDTAAVAITSDASSKADVTTENNSQAAASDMAGKELQTVATPRDATATTAVSTVPSEMKETQAAGEEKDSATAHTSLDGTVSENDKEPDSPSIAEPSSPVKEPENESNDKEDVGSEHTKKDQESDEAKEDTTSKPSTASTETGDNDGAGGTTPLASTAVVDNEAAGTKEEPSTEARDEIKKDEDKTTPSKDIQELEGTGDNNTDESKHTSEPVSSKAEDDKTEPQTDSEDEDETSTLVEKKHQEGKTDAQKSHEDKNESAPTTLSVKTETDNKTAAAVSTADDLELARKLQQQEENLANGLSVHAQENQDAWEEVPKKSKKKKTPAPP